MKTLIIVDMQKGFINKNNDFLVKNIKNLLKNDSFDKIIATKFVNHEKSQYVNFLNWSEMMSEEKQEFAINLPENALVFDKTSYAIRGGDLASAIDENDEVYISGTDHDSCVLAIAFQLFDYGVKPYVIWDCIGSHSQNPISKEEIEKIYLKNFGKDCIIKGKING